MAKKHIRRKINTNKPLSDFTTQEERYVAISKISRMPYFRKILADGDLNLVFFVEREIARGEFSRKTSDGKLDPCYAHGIWLIDEMSRVSDPDPWAEERKFYEEHVKPSRGYKKLKRKISRIIKILELKLRRLSDKRG